MVTHNDVAKGVTHRLTAMWPALGKRQGQREEIGHAVMKHAERIEPADIRAGMDRLIATTRTRQDDGGPAQPPSPHEVVGCILAASRDRQMKAPQPVLDHEPLAVREADERIREDIERGAGVRQDDAAMSNSTRRARGGVSFAEWWETVPDDERAQHAALYMMMTEPDKARALVDKARRRHGLRRMVGRA